MVSSDDPAPLSRSGFSLGEIFVRPALGSVTRGGNTTRLEPKVMAVLVVLAEHQGEVVSKQQLLASVWADAIVEEVALPRSISELRRVLGDDARQPRFIETIPKRGYRLLAKATPLPEAAPNAPPGTRRLAIGLAVATLAVAAGVWSVARRASPPPAGRETGTAPERKLIVVLPFENLGPPEDAYFAAGVTEEITSRLASSSNLGVISRTSSRQYEHAGKSIAIIAHELGVDYVLEGSVRWERRPEGTSRVRITPQLIRANDDTHVWTRIYERDFDEIFVLQAELAASVMQHVDAALLESGWPADSVPTRSREAYQAYLRGLDAVEDPTGYDEEQIRRAIQMFSRAVELDPGFASAWAELSLGHSRLYQLAFDRSTARLRLAGEAAQRAAALAPELPRARVALGYYHYRGFRDYERALREFALAERGLPDSSELHAAIGYIRRRQGHMQEALSRLSRARELDPRNASASYELATMLAILRDYRRGASFFEQAIALAPDLTYAYLGLARLHLLESGDPAAALGVVDRIPGPPHRVARAELALLGGEPDAALEWLGPPSGRAEFAALATAPTDFLRALAHEALGERERAQAAYARGERLLLERLAANADDFQAQAALGLVRAGLGKVEAAIRDGRRAVELMPTTKDANSGPFLEANLARIYARVGEHDAALEILEHLLSIPAGMAMSAQFLRLDPAFEPLRGQPGYQRLVGPAGP